MKLMAKTFYTEKDIDELFRQGVRSLKLTDNIALTDLAFERANRLGIQLEQAGADNPPAAPVRPYLSQSSSRHGSTSAPLPSTATPRSPAPVTAAQTGQPSSTHGDLEARIRKSVTARLGNQIDPALLDSIIQRVLKTTGLK